MGGGHNRKYTSKYKGLLLLSDDMSAADGYELNLLRNVGHLMLLDALTQSHLVAQAGRRATPQDADLVGKMMPYGSLTLGFWNTLQSNSPMTKFCADLDFAVAKGEVSEPLRRTVEAFAIAHGGISAGCGVGYEKLRAPDGVEFTYDNDLKMHAQLKSHAQQRNAVMFSVKPEDIQRVLEEYDMPANIREQMERWVGHGKFKQELVDVLKGQVSAFYKNHVNDAVRGMCPEDKFVFTPEGITVCIKFDCTMHTALPTLPAVGFGTVNATGGVTLHSHPMQEISNKLFQLLKCKPDMLADNDKALGVIFDLGLALRSQQAPDAAAINNLAQVAAWLAPTQTLFDQSSGTSQFKERFSHLAQALRESRGKLIAAFEKQKAASYIVSRFKYSRQAFLKPTAP